MTLLNKLDNLHLDTIEKNNWGETEFKGLHTFENSKSFIEINAEIVASKSAEITKDIAIKFGLWLSDNCYDSVSAYSEYNWGIKDDEWLISLEGLEKITTEQAFEIFLKTL